MNCNNCEKRWQNGEDKKGCQVFIKKPKNCWAFTTDKDWEVKVNAVVNAYSLKKVGHSFVTRGERNGI